MQCKWLSSGVAKSLVDQLPGILVVYYNTLLHELYTSIHGSTNLGELLACTKYNQILIFGACNTKKQPIVQPVAIVTTKQFVC